jgi:hypothetical protein
LQPLAASAEGKAASLFPGDQRLQRRVTVKHLRIYLGELLEDLGRQGEVTLRVEDTKGSVSGIRLAAWLKDRPLREVMSGLTTLFSQRSDRWEWQSESGKGYVLRHQLWPEAAAAATRQTMLERMAADAQTYHEVARLPDEQRRARAAALPHLFPGGYVDQARLDLFGALSRAQVTDLFRGAAIPIDPGQLAGRQRNALDSGMRGIPPVAPKDRSQPALFVKWERDVAGPHPLDTERSEHRVERHWRRVLGCVMVRQPGRWLALPGHGVPGVYPSRAPP